MVIGVRELVLLGVREEGVTAPETRRDSTGQIPVPRTAAEEMTFRNGDRT